MRRGMWGVGMWAAVALGAFAVAWAMVAPIGAVAEAAPRSITVPSLALRQPYAVDSLVAVAVSRDLFRVGRRPSPVAYDPTRGAVTPDVDAAPKPALLLVGIIAGELPSAVVEGVPGVEGSRVVRVGDVIGGLQVKRIERDRVVIVGMDTTWVLKVREPWKQ